jgi:6-pyruvoyltetrahydropterin/6-carboxytetrahydropterin synthase
MMFEVSVEQSFSAAHRLMGYKGKCENMHGHNWKVRAAIKNKNLDKHGMVMDFTDLKKVLVTILMRLDHKVLNDITYFKKINPTSENIAQYIHNEISLILTKPSIVSVWETDTSCASYYE